MQGSSVGTAGPPAVPPDVLQAALHIVKKRTAKYWQPSWNVAVELVGTLIGVQLWRFANPATYLTHPPALPYLTMQSVHVVARLFGFQIVNASQEEAQKVCLMPQQHLKATHTHNIHPSPNCIAMGFMGVCC